MQNALTVSNIALASVLSVSFDKSASAIIDYILECDVFDPEHCISLLHKKAREKADDVIKSIIGYELSGDQSVKMKVCRKHYDYINECVGTLENTISDLSKPYHKFIEFATSLPGIKEQSATFIIAKIGTDMTVLNLQNTCVPGRVLLHKIMKVLEKRKVSMFQELAFI